MNSAYIVDLDGTLALRVPGGRHWSDYKRCGEDLPNDPVMTMVRVLGAKSKIVIVSGREDCAMAESKDWLTRYSITFDAIFLRRTGDYRGDDVVKREIYERHIKGKYRVLGVIDDRNKVVDMWRSLGFMCAQVAPGDF